MGSIENLIRDENENTRVDFKRKQYPKKVCDDLIKDVMAMANADTRDDRYIILGVDHQAGGTKTIMEIPEGEFVDPADYQQIIAQYIEPPVHVDYFPFIYEGKRVGVLRIFNCDDQPYMMKTQLSESLKQGDCWIRSGARNRRATRADFDRMYAKQKAAVFALRLDDCIEGDKTFLVAMLDAVKPIPRYALINVEFEAQDGRKGSWGSNTSTMARSVNARAKHSLHRHSGSHIDEDRDSISLTARGRENAEYLLRHEYLSARFSMIDDSDSARLGVFRYEHNRDPKKGNSDGSIRIPTTTGG